MQGENTFESFMGWDETVKFTGFSVSKIYAWIKKGSFPRPYYTKNGDFLGWTKPQIFAWQRSLLEDKAA